MSFLLAPFRRKRVAPLDNLVPIAAQVFDERHGRFAKVRNSRVLIYWPHGFGDFVHLGYLLPLLDPSNTYWISRYGDDFSALYQNNQQFSMLPTGIKSITNGFGSSARDYHLGLRYGKGDGRTKTLHVTRQLADEMLKHGIDTVLWTDYPDPNGQQAFPFHSKVRSLAQNLVDPQRLAEFDLTQRLVHAVNFADDSAAAQLVTERLKAVFGNQDFAQLCVVLSGGHTAPNKNWDEANVRQFATMYTDGQPGKRTVILLNDEAWAAADSPTKHQAIATWSDLFPVSDATIASYEYAHLIRAVLRKCALFVGVPAGPMHLALAMGDIPTIGLWRVHHPAAYEEPNVLARHFLARSMLQANHPQVRISRTVPNGFADRTIELATDEIPARGVYEVATQLLHDAELHRLRESTN